VQRGAHHDVALDQITRPRMFARRAVAQGTSFITHMVERHQGTVEESLFLAYLALVCHSDLFSPKFGV